MSPQDVADAISLPGNWPKRVRIAVGAVVEPALLFIHIDNAAHRIGSTRELADPVPVEVMQGILAPPCLFRPPDKSLVVSQESHERKIFLPRFLCFRHHDPALPFRVVKGNDFQALLFIQPAKTAIFLWVGYRVR